MSIEEYRRKLTEKGLRVTPQRIAVLCAVYNLKGHPTVENIIEYIREHHPNIATGTVYKVLEVLVEKGLAKHVTTERDVMRYDAIMETHHHLYCSESDRIEDYFDKELNDLLKSYFHKKQIADFRIEDFKLQIIGQFVGKDGGQEESNTDDRNQNVIRD